MIKIALHGESGRMGKALQSLIADSPLFELAPYPSGDVILDFSHPDALSDLLKTAIARGCPLLIGTTGIQNREAIREASQKIPLLLAPNFSLGVLALKEAAVAIQSLMGQEVKIHIIEEHHLQKKDRPSGTALQLKEALGEVIEIFSIRNPGTIGNHTIIFSTEEEEIVLTHRAKSRLLFARGALLAAQKMMSQPKGYYELRDII